MNPEHFAGTRWKDVLVRQGQAACESADERWAADALCDYDNG
jgi:hypothetical protein